MRRRKGWMLMGWNSSLAHTRAREGNGRDRTVGYGTNVTIGLIGIGLGALGTRAGYVWVAFVHPYGLLNGSSDSRCFCSLIIAVVPRLAFEVLKAHTVTTSHLHHVLKARRLEPDTVSDRDVRDRARTTIQARRIVSIPKAVA